MYCSSTLVTHFPFSLSLLGPISHFALKISIPSNVCSYFHDIFLRCHSLSYVFLTHLSYVTLSLCYCIALSCTDHSFIFSRLQFLRFSPVLLYITIPSLLFLENILPLLFWYELSSFRFCQALFFYTTSYGYFSKPWHQLHLRISFILWYFLNKDLHLSYAIQTNLFFKYLYHVSSSTVPYFHSLSRSWSVLHLW